jgi:hypothetical protein
MPGINVPSGEGMPIARWRLECWALHLVVTAQRANQDDSSAGSARPGPLGRVERPMIFDRAQPDMSKAYGGGSEGYTDYPALERPAA